ncbi:CRISPR-associated protein, Cas1 family [Desulfatibacillum alkenivorans DSM 16219]|jgi:CRISPR-associated protein Cas1|uniref:CRISPR-associated endonuclease Cas1 n=1 Tax=Desulfatibacillum alkenivorans DSM 16219 TaxID=1121393 RepID=A0A1M6QU16_9BACT|nr:CRISPR-associated endonuclease Cas1 [Desulfatibacillum alkenivorans]SHK23603.1 CRISPR-associated protein, Cas1 family [Desulfatibacillum alkenivorans DSM 16219]
MIAYVTTQGSKLVKEGRHILVKKGNDTHRTLFTYKLEQLQLFGNIQMTHSALIQLMRNNIDTVFLTKNGRYLGRVESPEPKNVFLRKQQFLLLDDPEFGLNMAKSIVSGKMANMATLLLRIKRTKKADRAGSLARKIMDLGSGLQSAPTIDSVRGYEGKASALYFQGLPLGFVAEMGFTKRVRRPPTDPVNAVLSLLYTFVMNRVYAGVRAAGLDPYPGFLHALDYGRHSLVLDLMEEFRTTIADTLTLSLFNLKILSKDDFMESPRTPEPEHTIPLPDVNQDPLGQMASPEHEREHFDLPEQRMEEIAKPTPAPAKEPVKLKPDAFNKVIEAFEKKLSARFYHPAAEKELSYAQAVAFQASLYRKVIEGEARVYQPILLK